MSALRTISDSGKSVTTFTLDNKDFSLTRKVWDVEDLKLDPHNQRISFKIKQRGSLANTDEDLHKILWKLDSVKNLYQSIYQNGGLIEDPIINKDGTVVEGNCRTVALREILKKYPDDKRFLRTFVQVLPDKITDQQLMLLLGELHIAGKIEWRAYEQAEYVWKMSEIHGKSQDYLANFLRWNRSKIAQKKGAYEETKNYIERTGDLDGINRFSHFEEFMKKKPLRDIKERHPDFIIEFGDWVYEGKFKDAKHVRLLPKIIEDDEAFNAFKEHGFLEAQEILHQRNPSLASNLFSTIDSATSEIEKMPLQEIEALKNGDRAKRDKIKRLKEAIAKLESYTGGPI